MKRAQDLMEEAIGTYEQKNADYGESWKNIGHILHGLAQGEPVVLETPEDFIAIGLFTRRLDKLSRSFNAEFVADEMNFESGVDADTDDIPYAAMQAENKLDRKAAENIGRLTIGDEELGIDEINWVGPGCPVNPDDMEELSD